MKKLALETLGSSESPALLFLHGFMGQKKDWYFLAKKFSSRFFCLLIDLPGHGESDLTSDQDLSKTILNSLPKLKQKTSIIGYSMGGRVALEMVLKHPNIFNLAIIESSNPGLSLIEKKHRLLQEKKMFKNLNKNNYKNFLVNWYQNPIFGNLVNHPHFYQLLDKKFRDYPSALELLSVAVRPSLWENISNLSIPLLFLSGHQDKKYSNIGKKLNKLTSLIHHQEISNTGHNIHFEKPELFFKHLQEFIKKKLPEFFT